MTKVSLPQRQINRIYVGSNLAYEPERNRKSLALLTGYLQCRNWKTVMLTSDFLKISLRVFYLLQHRLNHGPGNNKLLAIYQIDTIWSILKPSFSLLTSMSTIYKI